MRFCTVCALPVRGVVCSGLLSRLLVLIGGFFCPSAFPWLSLLTGLVNQRCNRYAIITAEISFNVVLFWAFAFSISQVYRRDYQSLPSGCFRFQRRCVSAPENQQRPLEHHLLHTPWGRWHLREGNREVSSAWKLTSLYKQMVSKFSNDYCLTLAGLILEPRTFRAVHTGICRNTNTQVIVWIWTQSRFLHHTPC